VLKIIKALDSDSSAIAGGKCCMRFRRGSKVSSPTTADTLASMNLPDYSYQALLYFFDKPWFRHFSVLRDRSWRSQQDVVAMCGYHALPFPLLLRVAEAICELSVSRHRLTSCWICPEGLKYPEQMVALKSRAKSGSHMSFLAYFHLATIHDCFMPSWKIYSMFGWVDLGRYYNDVPFEFVPDHGWLGHRGTIETKTVPVTKIALLGVKP